MSSSFKNQAHFLVIYILTNSSFIIMLSQHRKGQTRLKEYQQINMQKIYTIWNNELGIEFNDQIGGGAGG